METTEGLPQHALAVLDDLIARLETLEKIDARLAAWDWRGHWPWEVGGWASWWDESFLFSENNGTALVKNLARLKETDLWHGVSAAIGAPWLERSITPELLLAPPWWSKHDQGLSPIWICLKEVLRVVLPRWRDVLEALRAIPGTVKKRPPARIEPPAESPAAKRPRMSPVSAADLLRQGYILADYSMWAGMHRSTKYNKRRRRGSVRADDGNYYEPPQPPARPTRPTSKKTR
jgi:hypothetical protein